MEFFIYLIVLIVLIAVVPTVFFVILVRIFDILARFMDDETPWFLFTSAIFIILMFGFVVYFVYFTNMLGWRYSGSDKAALRDIHISTQGDSWRHEWDELGFSDPWRTWVGYANGYGVVTAKDGLFGEKRVVGLYLSNNNLGGRIPHSLTRLDKLEALYLDGNHLRGCIPAALFRVPNNDLALIDLPLCDAPPAPAPTPESGIASGPSSGPRTPSPESDPCPPGEPCVALHGDKTETVVGEPITLTFSAVNDITLPELTAQMVIRIPSGWLANSTEWTDACTALCNLAMKIPTGENRTTRVEIYPNESGDFSLRATLRWFAGEGAEASAKQRDEIINVRVN